ncbi:MAG: TIGR04076 family protein [Bacillota bacterium]|nr:TIGR04076 family protein [Bacillota bacterium]
MAGDRKFRVTVKEVVRKGCPAGHKVGDTFEFGRGCPEGLCITAFHAIYPLVTAFWCGAEIPWEKDKNKVHVACPDSNCIVVFEVENLITKDKQIEHSEE